jgi:hypothetical protein
MENTMREILNPTRETEEGHITSLMEIFMKEST